METEGAGMRERMPWWAVNGKVGFGVDLSFSCYVELSSANRQDKNSQKWSKALSMSRGCQDVEKHA